jgi:hypothetical protein
MNVRWNELVTMTAAVAIVCAVVLSGCSIPGIGGGGTEGTTTLTLDSGSVIPSLTTTTMIEPPTTDTSAPSAGNAFPTPEEAVQAEVGREWVVSTAWMQGDEAEVWAGPPYSEFVLGFAVTRTAAGWHVVDTWDLGDEGDDHGSTGGYDDILGGPWYPGDFPEIFELGSGLFEPFRTDIYPRPANTSYPSSGDAWVVWDSLGRMLNDLKMGRITEATRYVTSDFYQIWYFSLFDEVEVRLREFELTGWEDMGGGFYSVWADLRFNPAGGGAYRQKAVFTGVVNRGGSGILVYADLWEPR